MNKHIKIEICCGSIEDVQVASQFPIDRIELNSALELGGLTCSNGTLKEARKLTDLPICCMVRPRGAGFHYTEAQFQSMLFDAEELIKFGADGIVFGFLNKDTTVDKNRTLEMSNLIKKHGKEVIFHKAFDETPDLMAACATLIECGVDRILTSGGPSVEKGLPILNELIKHHNHQITILIGGGVRDYNVLEIINKTNCTEVHTSAKHTAFDNGDFIEVSSENLRKIMIALNKM